MFRHIVLFWLKDKGAENIRNTVETLASMTGKIPGMLTLEASADAAGTPRSCDICLCETFESRQAYEAYRTHPVHLPVQAHMHSVMDFSHSADYEVPES
ncbi:MAG: Dabb family protein [Candidatus Limiplasma sp.]|nr:Dabb family protein [Candidatus Limiplasma sp.]MEA5146707.1 Dabb family protein [Candidatus Limiplasma sp.]